MKEGKQAFTIEVDEAEGLCALGETLGNQCRLAGKIPVISCEGACIKGEIARLAANIVGKVAPFQRSCHGSMFTVPHSAIAEWMRQAEKVVVIDGCFIQCHGRLVKNLIDEGHLTQFDAHSIHQQYGDIFDVEAVPLEERLSCARMVADRILNVLQKDLGDSPKAC
jgi:hypothetical protein